MNRWLDCVPSNHNFWLISPSKNIKQKNVRDRFIGHLAILIYSLCEHRVGDEQSRRQVHKCSWLVVWITYFNSLWLTFPLTLLHCSHLLNRKRLHSLERMCLSIPQLQPLWFETVWMSLQTSSCYRAASRISKYKTYSVSLCGNVLSLIKHSRGFFLHVSLFFFVRRTYCIS